MTPPKSDRLHPDIIKQAAQWMMRIGDTPDAATQQACFQWRQADTQHELAWQRLQSISHDVSAVTDSGVSNATASHTIIRYCEQRSRRTTLKWMLGGIGVGLGTLGWAGARQGLWDGSEVYQTATGEQHIMTLPDGTVLTMNTGSVVALNYSEQQRRIDLRSGEILIVTAHDPNDRPFSVQTQNGLLTPLGTRFVVRQMDNSLNTTRLTVFEGAVRVTPINQASSALVVPAGEELEFDAQTFYPSKAVSSTVPDWSVGMLVANRMRLDQFLAELSRYRPGILRCDDEVAGQEVTGAFRIDNTDKTLEVLASVLNLTLRYRTRYWVSLGRD